MNCGSGLVEEAVKYQRRVLSNSSYFSYVAQENNGVKYYHSMKLAISCMEYAKVVNRLTEDLELGVLRKLEKVLVKNINSAINNSNGLGWALQLNIESSYLEMIKMLEDYLDNETDLENSVALFEYLYHFFVELLAVDDILGDVMVQDGEVVEIK